MSYHRKENTITEGKQTTTYKSINAAKREMWALQTGTKVRPRPADARKTGTGNRKRGYDTGLGQQPHWFTTEK